MRSYQYLTREKHEEIMANQLLRSGTSIGANAHEAVYGTSKQDFIAKLHIALKEAAETEYWLILLTRTEYLTTIQSESLMSDCLEIKRYLLQHSIRQRRQKRKNKMPLKKAANAF
ncbi:four helix bundle protein [Gemmiger formicilis]|nr:four helix bundle protein [Gemmiger formicilis]